MTLIVTGVFFLRDPRPPPLKLVPPQGRLIVLASDRVCVYLRRRPHRGVPQALRHYRQRHAIG